MHLHTFLNAPHAGQTLLMFKCLLQLTRFLWGRLMSEVVGRLSALINTLQTAVKWVHPNWECLTRKHLNQLLNKRVHPFPSLPSSLGPHSTTTANTSPPPLPSDLMEEIHLCHLVARFVSATRSK